MDELEKVLNSLEGNKEVILDSDREKAIHRTITLLKKSLATIPANETCNHDYEDICAYFDNKLEPELTSQVEDQIFACDNCFKLYSFLQKRE
jgi:hypothetical protein